RPVRLALGALAVACAASFLGGLVWLGAHGSDSAGTASDGSAKSAADGGGKSAYAPEMHLACSRVLVEGRVVSIVPRADGDVRVLLDVKRYYRPERAVRDHPRFAVTLHGTARADLKPGTYTLIRTPVYPEDRQDWETGGGVADVRKEILKALPGAEGLTCARPQD
ncbi:hypothetical protein G3I40_02840, partial [Streptomyces sp. SID14478]|nr:hypothetical protein [Streptomyces sp. SID14478]